MRYQEILRALFEGKEEYIVANQGTQLIQAARDRREPGADKLTADQIVSELSKMDPTTNKKYLQWLANMYIRDLASSMSFKDKDHQEILPRLKKFDAAMKSREFQGSKDINQYKDFGQLLDTLRKFQEKTGGDQAQSKSQKEKEIVSQGAKLLFQDANLEIYELLTKEAGKAMCAGMDLCTARQDDDKNMFDSYKAQGPIYLLKMPNLTPVRRWQFHVESNEFKDENNREINKQDIALLSKQPGYKKFLNMLIDKHYKPYLKYLEPEKNSSGKKSK